MQPLSVALLSYGMSGKVFHAPFLLAEPGFALSAIWERTKTASSLDFPDAKLYRKLEDLLADPSIELVIVNTPTHCHADHAHLALEAGKHVVVEKAFTTHLAEAQSLANLAQSKQLQLCVYQNRRWDSEFLLLQKTLSSGVLGELVEVHFSFNRYKPNLGAKQHKELPGPGAGLLMDLGPHLLDQALFLFGKPLRFGIERYGRRAGTQVDDAFDLVLFYQSFTVYLHSSLLVAAALPAYVVHGRKGSLVLERSDPQEADLLAGLQPPPFQNLSPTMDSTWGHPRATVKTPQVSAWDGNQIETHTLDHIPGHYGAFYAQLYACIRAGGPPPVALKDSLLQMEILTAATAAPIQFSAT